MSQPKGPQRSEERRDSGRSRGPYLIYSVVDQLGRDIVVGEYGEANPFRGEAELAAKIGVGRSVLREAVKILGAKGLLTGRPRHGTWVQSEEHWNLLDPDVLRWLLERKFSLQRLMQFTEVRLAIEPIAAGLAASNPDPGALQPIEKAIRRMEAAESGDDDPLDSDIAFHVSILRASGNPFFLTLQDLVSSALKTSIRLTNQMKGVRLADVALHRSVFDAIEARNAKLARSRMEALIMSAIDLIKQTMEAKSAASPERAAATAPLPKKKGKQARKR
jgi:DNA-binding FadR family transcriptional regulator